MHKVYTSVQLNTKDTLTAIAVKDLVKKFKEVKAVDNISFSIDKGEIFAFLGPNGVGKTTTIKILITLLNPTNGFLSISGFDVITEKNLVRKSFGIDFIFLGTLALILFIFGSYSFSKIQI